MTEVEVGGAAGCVEVDVGDEIVIRLPEISTTGDVWSIGSMSDGLLLTGDSPPGAGGTRVLRLRLAGPTGGQVLLQRCRGEAAPSEERRITVTVRR